jgi:hypothetical protein
MGKDRDGQVQGKMVMKLNKYEIKDIHDLFNTVIQALQDLDDMIEQYKLDYDVSDEYYTILEQYTSFIKEYGPKE